MVHLARVIGKCHLHMTYSNANGMYHRPHSNVPDLWSLVVIVVRKRKEATFSAGSAQSHTPSA
jgi:hypothetical protein